MVLLKITVYKFNLFSGKFTNSPSWPSGAAQELFSLKKQVPNH